MKNPLKNLALMALMIETMTPPREPRTKSTPIITKADPAKKRKRKLVQKSRRMNRK